MADYRVLSIQNEAELIEPRLLKAKTRSALDVGSHWGPVSALLEPEGIETVCVDLDPEIVTVAHKPAVHTSAVDLPFDDEKLDAVTAMNVLYFLDKPELAVQEAWRVLRPRGWFVACTQAPDNDPELRDVDPRWGKPSTFDGDNAEVIVRTVFEHVEVEPRDMVAYNLTTREAITDYVEVYCKIAREEAVRRSAALEPPMTIIKRMGILIWA